MILKKESTSLSLLKKYILNFKNEQLSLYKKKDF